MYIHKYIFILGLGKQPLFFENLIVAIKAHSRKVKRFPWLQRKFFLTKQSTLVRNWPTHPHTGESVQIFHGFRLWPNKHICRNAFGFNFGRRLWDRRRLVLFCLFISQVPAHIYPISRGPEDTHTHPWKECQQLVASVSVAHSRRVETVK